MKTDRFDDEFRRKLLGLPADTDANEANRIHAFVQANRPARSGLDWGHWLLYGAGAALLTGSLYYHSIQHSTTEQLRSSLDSLAHQPAVAVRVPSPVSPSPHVDTVYITRYRDRTVRVLVGDPVRFNPADSPLSGDPPRNDQVSSAPLPRPQTNVAPVESLAMDADSVAVATHEPRLESVNEHPDTRSRMAVVPGRDRTALTGRRTGQTTRSGSSGKSRSGGSPAEPPMVNARTINAPGAYALVGGVPVTDASENTLSAREPESGDYVALPLVINPLGPHSFNTVPWSATLSAYTVSAPAAAPPVVARQKPAFRVNWPTMSLAGAQYYTGGGLTVANDQLSGSLLGEIRWRHRWSLQTGLQWGSVRGYQYYTAEQFEDRERQNFRSLYAPYVPPNYDLLNIDQTYTVLQLPVTIAYQYPLGRGWGVRLGLGMDIDLYVRNRTRFDYKENNRNFEQGLYKATVPASPFNNVTGSVGLERLWKRWLFRAGPYISPQLKPVEYRQEELYWGAKVQVLWRLGRR